MQPLLTGGLQRNRRSHGKRAARAAIPQLTPRYRGSIKGVGNDYPSPIIRLLDMTRSSLIASGILIIGAVLFLDGCLLSKYHVPECVEKKIRIAGTRCNKNIELDSATCNDLLNDALIQAVRDDSLDPASMKEMEDTFVLGCTSHRTKLKKKTQCDPQLGELFLKYQCTKKAAENADRDDATELENIQKETAFEYFSLAHKKGLP